MSNKISLLLSIFFISLIFFCGVDLIMIQAMFSSLDSISETISFKISNNEITSDGDIAPSLKKYLLDNFAIEIKSENKDQFIFKEGDIYAYSLNKEYSPIILSINPINIEVKRYTVIGINKI